MVKSEVNLHISANKLLIKPIDSYENYKDLGW